MSEAADTLHAAVVQIIAREQSRTLVQHRQRINQKSVGRKLARDERIGDMNAEECARFRQLLRLGLQPHPGNL